MKTKEELNEEELAQIVGGVDVPDWIIPLSPDDIKPPRVVEPGSYRLDYIIAP